MLIAYKFHTSNIKTLKIEQRDILSFVYSFDSIGIENHFDKW